MENRTVVVDECGTIIAFVEDLTDEQAMKLVREHPEYRIREEDKIELLEEVQYEP